MRIAILLALLMQSFPSPGPGRASGVSTGQHVLNTDAFGGTAATVLHTYNANWNNAPLSNQWNDCDISTPNGGVSTVAGGACGDYSTAATWTNDQFVQMTLVAVPTGEAMVCVRLSGATGNNPQGYCAGADPNLSSGSYFLLKWTAGASSTLTSHVQTPTVNDVMNLQIQGTAITFKVNGTTIITFTDATFATGNPGLQIGSTGAAKTLSAWSAGSVT